VGRPLSEKTKRILELAQEGCSQTEIAEAVNLTIQGVSNAIRRHSKHYKNTAANKIPQSPIVQIYSEGSRKKIEKGVSEGFIPPGPDEIAFDLVDAMTIWESLSRVKRQLSGTRSSDFKKRLMPIISRLGYELKKRGKIW